MPRIDRTKFDITRTNDAIDRLLAVTTNPRHRFLLQTFYRHRFLEIAGRYEEIFAPDMTVETRPVIVGRSSDGQAVVDKGLASGERVVTDGQLRLVPGSKVELKQAAVPPSSTGTAQNSQNPRPQGE